MLNLYSYAGCSFQYFTLAKGQSLDLKKSVRLPPHVHHVNICPHPPLLSTSAHCWVEEEAAKCSRVSMTSQIGRRYNISITRAPATPNFTLSWISCFTAYQYFMKKSKKFDKWFSINHILEKYKDTGYIAFYPTFWSTIVIRCILKVYYKI